MIWAFAKAQPYFNIFKSINKFLRYIVKKPYTNSVLIFTVLWIRFRIRYFTGSSILSVLISYCVFYNMLFFNGLKNV